MSLKNTEKLITISAKLYEKIQCACKELLTTHPLAESARQYLNKRITISNQEKFDFGYHPDDDHLDVLLEKIPEKMLKYLGMIYPYHVQNGDYRVFINKGILSNHNLTMPYRDIYGNIKGLVGRSLLSNDEIKSKNTTKYKYTKFHKSLHLFGLNQAKSSIIKNNSVILVEGQFDCISCHEHDIHNVVALGGSSLTKRQFQLLNRFTDKFYLLLDNDLAGQKAHNKIIAKYSKLANFEELNILGEYKDIDEYLHSNYTKSNIFELIRRINAR